MTLSPIADIAAARYERRGSCQRCGKCCENEECEHFRSGEVAMCLIHDQDRPQRCVEFPANPPIVFEGCGYRFVDRWENDRVVGYREV